MEPIKTNPFKIDPRIYMRENFRLHIDRIAPLVLGLYTGLLVMVYFVHDRQLTLFTLTSMAVTVPGALLYRWLRMKKAFQHKGFLSSQTMEFSESEFHVSNYDGVNSSAPWTRFTKIVFTDSHALFFIGKKIISVNRDAFQTKEDEAEFRAFAEGRGLLKKR